MSRISAFALVAALAVTGCGLKELDSKQEARFTASLGNIGKSVAAIKTTGKRYGGRQNTAANPLQRPEVRELVSAICATGTTGGERDQDVEEIVDKMEKSVFAGDCKMPMEFPGQDAGKDMKEVRFAINGENCPLSLDFSLKPTGKPESMSAEFSIKYAVKDEAILAITDISGMEMTGSMSVSSSGASTQPGAMPSGPVSTSVEVDLKGTIHSQKEGDLHPYLKMSVSQEINVSGTSITGSQEMDLALGMEFKDFTGELTAKVSVSSGSQPSVEFALNGKEITPQKFQSLIVSAGLGDYISTPKTDAKPGQEEVDEDEKKEKSEKKRRPTSPKQPEETPEEE